MRRKTLQFFRFALTAGAVELFTASAAFAGGGVVLHVDDDAAAGGDGTASAPFSTVGAAIAHANELGGATVLVAPGTYPVSSSIHITAPTVLRGSNRMKIDADGWPTGVIVPGTETRILGTSALGSRNMINVGHVDGPVLSGVTIQDLTLDLGPGTGDDVDLVNTQDFLVRGNKVLGPTAFIGIAPSASSGRIVGNYITGVGCGSCIGGGSATSPARVEFVGNRSTGNRFGGVLLLGTGTLANDPGANLLEIDIRDNDLSGNTFSPRFSFGIRIMIIRRDNGLPADEQSDGNVVARIQGNRIVGNEIGLSIDAGFPYRQYRTAPPPAPLTCDTRVYTGSFDLWFRGNTVAGSLLTPALISFTRNSASLNQATLPSWQYLQGATYTIDDPEGSLAGYWLDHAERDRFTGGVCDADATAELLDNTLIYNGAPVGYGYTVE